MSNRKYSPRRATEQLEADPTVRVTISVRKSDEEKIKDKASKGGISISRLLAEAALSDQLLNVMTDGQVIARQEDNIRQLGHLCDVWVFGGSGPKFPFVGAKEAALRKLWADRAVNGIHHHVYWDLDLADPEGMRQFITGTVRVARDIEEKEAQGRIIHHGVTVGQLDLTTYNAFIALQRQIAKEELGTSIQIEAPFDIGAAAKSTDEQMKTKAHEARWLCRFGEMGSLVAVLPRGFGQIPTACLLHDALLLHPDGQRVDLWLWLERMEAERLALHAKEYLFLMQSVRQSGA